MCTYWNKVNLAKLKTKRKKKIDSIGIGLASPEEIRRWGERRLPNGTLIGKVDKDHTVDYESLKPIQGGLFCERIFGPVEDFYCSCERRGEKNEKYCPTCEVEFTKSRVRRTRMGYIPLAVPVAHVWYLRGRPSYIANLIGKSRNAVDRLAYGETLCESFIGKTSLDFFRLGEIDTQSKQHHLLAPTKNQTKQFSFLPAHRKSETEEKKEEIDLTITNKSQIFSNKINATQPIQPYLDNLLNKGEPVPFHSRQFARSYGMKEIERISACIVTAKEMNRIISIIDYPEGLRVATSSLQCSIVQRAYCTRFVSTVSKAKMITNTTNPHSNLETPFLTQYHLLYYVRYRLDRLYKRYNKQSIPALCIPIEAGKVTPLQSVPSSVLCTVQIVNAQAKKKRVLSHTKVSISSFCLTNNDSSMHHRCKGKKQWSDVEGRDHSFRYSFVSHSSPLLRMEYGGKKEYNLYPERSKGLSQSSRENKLTKVVSQVIKKEADSKFVTRYTEIQKKVNIGQFPRLARLISTTQHNELILTKYNKLHSLPLFSTFVYKEWSHRFSFFEYFIWLARKEDLALPFYSSKMEQQHESNICYTARQNFLNLVKDKFLLRFFPSIKKGMLTTQTQYKRFQTSTTKGLHSMTNFVGTAALPTSLVQQDHRRRDSNQFFQLRTKKGFLMLDLQSKTLSDDNSQIREHRKKHVIVTSARRGLFSAHLAYSLNETNWGMSKELVNSRSFFCTNKTKSVNVISKWDNTSICVTPTVSSFANMANNGLSNYVLTTNLNDKKREDPIENLSILTHTQQNNKWVGKLGVDDTQQFPRLTELLSFTGGTALRYLLSRFDLVFLGKFLRHELKNLELKVNNLLALKMLTYSQGLLLGKLAKRRSKQLRRLKLMELFQSQKSNPEWMVLSVLPVLPPDLRPILRVNDDFVVASDLNRLYQTVLRRNNTIHERLDDPLPCPESGLFRQRSLQKAVDGLLENGKGGGTPLCASKRRPLVSLSHVLKGKKGLFRQHLLGKRVDYSGRSVIVVGPKLSLHECGLPKEMAMELFQPFLLYKLKAKGLASSNTTARRLIQQEDPIVWQILKQLVYEHPVLLNRAPTLHRLGIQAFQPRLVSGRAILLHPLVCNGFNADFDGDQMAVHVPLSFQARAEAWKIMWSKNNLLSPATGQPILVPSQDMVLGCYYLSVFVPRVLGFLTPSVSTVAAASSQQDSLLTFFEGNEYSEDNTPSQGYCYTNQLPMLRKTVRSTETGLAKHGKLVGTDENAMMRMPNNVFHSSLFSSSVENPFVEKHRTTWSQSIGQLQRKLEDRMFLSTGKKKSPGTKGFDIFKMKYRGSLSPVLCNKLKKHDQVNRSTLPTSLVQLVQLFGITYRSTHQILLSLEWGKKKQQATLLTIWHKVLNPFLYGNTYTFYANKMSPAFLRIRVKPIPSLTFSKREMERKFVTTRMYKDRSQRWLALFPFSNTTKTIQGHSTRKYVSYITVSISKNKQVIMLPTMPVGLSFYSIFGEQKHTTKNIPLNNKTDVNFHYSSTNFINTIKLHSNHYLRRRDRLDGGYSKHFVQSVPSSKVMIGRRGRLKWKSNTCIEKGKKKGLYFSNLQDSLIAFFQGKLQTHTPFWVRLDSTDSFRSNLTGSLLASITSVGSAGGKQDNYSYPNPFGNAQTLPPSQHQVVQHIGTTFSGNRSTGNAMQKLIGEKADSKKRLTVSNLQIALLQPQYGSSHQVCKTLFQSYYHNIVVEGNDILDPPLELRLSADGTLVKVLPTFQHHFSYSATMVDQCQEKAIRYMRTTAGRVVINQALY